MSGWTRKSGAIFLRGINVVAEHQLALCILEMTPVGFAQGIHPMSYQPTTFSIGTPIR